MTHPDERENNGYLDEVADLVEAFRYELCAECGHDLDRHTISPDPLGHAHAWCMTEGDDDGA